MLLAKMWQVNLINRSIYNVIIAFTHDYSKLDGGELKVKS